MPSAMPFFDAFLWQDILLPIIQLIIHHHYTLITGIVKFSFAYGMNYHRHSAQIGGRVLHIPAGAGKACFWWYCVLLALFSFDNCQHDVLLSPAVCPSGHRQAGFFVRSYNMQAVNSAQCCDVWEYHRFFRGNRCANGASRV